ncbi:MAG: FkbM family methyltransferase [Bacteroidetes bacterium]|nr:FkbM family methyltransferase [Bacteroidota bacterium]HET6244032.1 FkbM family methyltransferase [Bacteroidia bacterium]
MKQLILSFFKFYFRHFPIRKGKIPILNLLDRLSLTKNVSATVKFDDNINVNVNLNDWIQKQIYFFGIYEIEKTETYFWKKIIKPGFIILDIGANIGYYSLLASKLTGIQGKIYSFEPVKATFNKLLNNIQLNNFQNIFINNIAISDIEGEIELFVADDLNTGTSSITLHHNFSGQKEIAKSLPLDSFVQSNKEIHKIDLIKIDVEGSEFHVLKGMKYVLSEFQPFILIEILDEKLNLVNTNKEEVYAYMEKFNYFPFEIISSDKVKPILVPKEGGLLLFKHAKKDLPAGIIIEK